MSTLQVIRHVRNKELTVDEQVLKFVSTVCPDEAELYKRVEPDSLSVEASEGWQYLLQFSAGNQYTEERIAQDLSNLRRQNSLLEEQMRQSDNEQLARDVAKHTHNLFSVTKDPMFENFMEDLKAGLTPTEQLMFLGCTSFIKFNKIMKGLMKAQPMYNRITTAASQFLNQYRCVPQFWAAAQDAHDANRTGNDDQHQGVLDSANFILDVLRDRPDVHIKGAPMLAALANYAEVHHARLMEEREMVLKALREAEVACRNQFARSE